MRPADGVTLAEAAHIIGCSVGSVQNCIKDGRLPALGRYEHRRVSRADAEALALQQRSSLVPLPDEVSYWVGNREAAVILGVNQQRVHQLAAAGRIPFEVHVSGRRLFRRQQLMTVANARNAMWTKGSQSRR